MGEKKCTIYFLFCGKRGGVGSALNIFSIFYTHHRIPNKHMMTINFDTITNDYEVIYVIKTVMKYYLKKIDTSFHQRLPNMVQCLFADVIHAEFLKFVGPIGPRGQKIMRSANNVGPHSTKHF